MLVLFIDSSFPNLSNTKCSCKQPKKMSEFMTIHPSHFGCIKSAVLTGLRKAYIEASCPGLGIGIKISGLSVRPLVIDPNEGCCITKCTL